MGAYKRDAVVVIQLGAYIHRVLTLISMGAIPILRYIRLHNTDIFNEF